MKNKFLIFPLALAILFLARPTLADSLTLGQTSVNLNIGQSISVSIYTSSGRTANVVSNSNSSVVSAVVNGDNLSLFGTSSGYSQVRVCTYYADQCDTINVTVGGNDSGNYGSISFSTSQVNLSVGQTTSITVYNNYYSNISNSFYISSNSNPNIVGASILGSSLTLSGYSNGNSTITVCNSTNYYSNQCGSVGVYVSGGSSGTITFSNNSVNANLGQTVAITIYNNSNYNYSNSYYVSNNSNPSIAANL